MGYTVDVSQIESAILQLAGALNRARPAVAPIVSGDSGSTLRWLQSVRRLKRLRFEHDYFVEPAWEILLELTRTRLVGQPVYIGELFLISLLPQTTAHRLVRQMVKDGWIVRYRCKHDQRRVSVEISDLGLRRVVSYLEEIGSQPKQT